MHYPAHIHIKHTQTIVYTHSQIHTTYLYTHVYTTHRLDIGMYTCINYVHTHNLHTYTHKHNTYTL